MENRGEIRDSDTNFESKRRRTNTTGHYISTLDGLANCEANFLMCTYIRMYVLSLLFALIHMTFILSYFQHTYRQNLVQPLSAFIACKREILLSVTMACKRSKYVGHDYVEILSVKK